MFNLRSSELTIRKSPRKCCGTASSWSRRRPRRRESAIESFARATACAAADPSCPRAGLAEVLRHGAIPAETKRLQDIILWPIGIGAAVTFIASAVEFLRRVYRVRKFLIERGGLQFPSWPETVITFGFPIANFFVPWNRLDVIRETLRTHRDTGKFSLAPDPEKKLRKLGIIWGITSLVTVRGQIEDATWMSMVLIVELVLIALSLWTFNMATRWLSELQTDFEAVTVTA